MDGTLLDSAPGIGESLTHALRALGHDFFPAANLHERFGPPMRGIVEALLAPYADTRVDECLALYREHYGEQGLYSCSVYPGVESVLRQLAGDGVALYVATSKRQVFAQRMLEHVQLGGYFTKVCGSVPSGALDDKTQLLRSLLDSLPEPLAARCMVGDKRDDMLAAASNGIPALGALWGYGSAEELRGSGASILVSAPVQLPVAIETVLGAID